VSGPLRLADEAWRWGGVRVLLAMERWRELGGRSANMRSMGERGMWVSVAERGMDLRV